LLALLLALFRGYFAPFVDVIEYGRMKNSGRYPLGFGGGNSGPVIALQLEKILERHSLLKEPRHLAAVIVAYVRVGEAVCAMMAKDSRRGRT
jgi:hypothetical protein